MGSINNEDIKEFISCLDSILSKEVKLEGGYVYPLDHASHEYMSTDKHLIIERRLDDNEKLTINFFKKLHSWFPANPSKKETVERGNKLYYDKVIQSEDLEIFKNSYVNYRVDKGNSSVSQKEYRLWNIIIKNNYIVILGKKGQGKTAFINYWFNNYTEKLEHSNILWFRVDASKLYGLRSLFETNGKEFKLETYHKIHSVYVYLKYKNQSNSLISKITSLVIDNALENESLNNALDEMEGILAEATEYEDGKATEKFLRLIVENEKHLKFIDTIYHECEQIRKRLNYNILYVIDGLDNISWVRNETIQYKRLCDEVSSLFVNDFIKPYASDFKIMLILRHETWKDIKARKLDHLNDDQLKIPAICEIAPTCVKEVIIHKSTESDEPKSNYFQNKKNNLKNGMKSEFGSVTGVKKLNNEIKLFSSFSHSYVDNVMSAIKKRYEELESCSFDTNETNLSSKSFSDSTQMLSILFNNNMRSCVDNFVENHATIQYALKRGVQRADSPNRMPQYLLLNGRIFLDSEYHVGRIRGEAYPNIFWWDRKLTNNDNKWYGFVVLRMLQLLAHSKKKLTDKQLVEIISKLFRLNLNVVYWSFERMVKYGLMNISHNRMASDEAENSYFVAISEKGKFILDYIFMYPEWLYFCALDTPVPEHIMNDTRLFKIHRDVGLEFIINFNTAFIVTSITFTRIIRSQQKIDLNILNETIHTTNIDGVFNVTSDAESCFKIPSHQFHFLKKSIHHYLRSLNIKKGKESRHEACMLLQDLKGVYNY